MTIKLIIFDLWATLAYRKGDHHHLYLKKILKETNSNIPIKKFVKIFESSIQTKKWESKFEAYKNLCKNMNLVTTKENIGLLIKIRTSAENKTTVYSHSIKMLKDLKKQGYKIGLVSNSSVFAIDALNKKTNLLKYIDYPLFAYDVGYIKPEIKFFKEILRISKCKADESIMIGDKLGDDVLPPRKIGMHSLYYKNYRQLKKDLKEFKVNI